MRTVSSPVYSVRTRRPAQSRSAMRPHALVLALCALSAYAATIPDKKDIEKKLTEVVKEVLSKDENTQICEQELIENNDKIKDIENNLKSVQPVDIPVKVVVEDVKPALKSEADKKENNEIIPESGESSEIKREEPDLKNPGAPQRTQHDTQHPDALDIATRNTNWNENPAYVAIQKELHNLKDTLQNQMDKLQEYWHSQPVEVKPEDPVRLRASVRQDTTTSTQAPFWSNPLQSWQNWASNWQSQLSNVNNTINSYFSNQTSNNSNSSCGGGWGGWASNLNFGNQQGQGQQTQSDEQRPPGIWQQVQQNVQNFLSGGSQPPASAQSDPAQPAQPNRPVIQAFQSAIQQAGNLFNRPQGNAQPAQSAQPAQPDATQEGSNVVPKPDESEKQKPDQPVTQSGPIKQMIGSNPVMQGIAGAMQRIQQTIIPNKPREDVKDASSGEKEGQDTKFGLVHLKPPKPAHHDHHGGGGGGGSVANGDTIDSDISAPVNKPGVEDQKVADEPSAPQKEAEDKPSQVEKEARKD